MVEQWVAWFACCLGFCSRRHFRTIPRSARISHSPTSCFASRTDFCAYIAPPAHTSKPWPLVPCSGTPFARARRLRTEHAGCESVPPGTCHDAGGRRARASRSGVTPIGIQSAAGGLAKSIIFCDPVRRAARGAKAAGRPERGHRQLVRTSDRALPERNHDHRRALVESRGRRDARPPRTGGAESELKKGGADCGAQACK